MKTKLNYCLLINSLWFIFSLQLSAQTTRYVNQSGSNIGDCSNPSSPCYSIDYAIDMADAGDIINIANGVYTENIEFAPPMYVSLQGESESGTIVQANQSPGTAASRVLSISLLGNSITISNLTIRNGVSDTGAGMYISGGLYNISNVTISDNQALNSGGGMSALSTQLNLMNVTFKNNSTSSLTTFGGGGLYAQNTDLAMTNVIFENNSCGRLGGALLTINVQATQAFQNIIFSGNHSNIFGASLSLPTNFGGGAIYNYESELIFSGAEFTNNLANTDGGAIYNGLNGTIELENVIFNDNQAQRNGGGIYNENTVKYTNVTFNNNTVNKSGGAIYNMSEVPTEISGITFNGNKSQSFSAGDGGGAFYNQNNIQIIFSNCSFINNHASHSGGGIYLNDNISDPVIINSIFFNNEANFGGALYQKSTSSKIINSTIYKNYGFYGGGGVYNNTSSIVLENSIILNNVGGDNGNDILNATSDSYVDLLFCLYDNESNSIVDGGGITVDNCVIGDPDFIDADNGDFHLNQNSPAIISGNPNTDFTIFPTDNNDPVDLDGNPRITNQIVDIGAYEWQGELSTHSLVADKEIFSLYPNPVETELFITSEEPLEKIEIFNLQGSLVVRQEIQRSSETFQYNLSGLAAGVYFIRIHSSEQEEIRKIIKN